jgi:hypothetical protein
MLENLRKGIVLDRSRCAKACNLSSLLNVYGDKTKISEFSNFSGIGKPVQIGGPGH